MSTLSSVDLDQALGVARAAARKGRDVLLHYFGELEQVREKDSAGLVTEADLESERVIGECLLSQFPEISIMAEEETHARGGKSAASGASVRWVIDPLDGTTNYVHRFPVFCISIGLEINGEIVVSVIDAPKMNQVFHAVKGKGAFENDRLIKVSSTKQFADSLLATGFISHEKGLTEQVEIFRKFLGESRGVRRAGAAAYDLCMVAMGVFDAFWERYLNPWDTAGGVLLVREAGGRVTRYDGGEYTIMDETLVASNSLLHPALVQGIQSCQKSVPHH